MSVGGRPADMGCYRSLRCRPLGDRVWERRCGTYACLNAARTNVRWRNRKKAVTQKLDYGLRATWGPVSSLIERGVGTACPGPSMSTSQRGG